jgi:hypothetical protein
VKALFRILWFLTLWELPLPFQRVLRAKESASYNDGRCLLAAANRALLKVSRHDSKDRKMAEPRNQQMPVGAFGVLRGATPKYRKGPKLNRLFRQHSSQLK